MFSDAPRWYRLLVIDGASDTMRKGSVACKRLTNRSVSSVVIILIKRLTYLLKQFPKVIKNSQQS